MPRPTFLADAAVRDAAPQSHTGSGLVRSSVSSFLVQRMMVAVIEPDRSLPHQELVPLIGIVRGNHRQPVNAHTALGDGDHRS